VALDQQRILPVSSLVNGIYGMRDVCISVPTVVGRAGVVRQLEVDLYPKEVSALQQSSRVLRETIDQVLSKRPASANASAPAKVPSANGSPKPPVRVTISGGGRIGR
jgi:L-lactate dehydrogenase